MFSGVSKQHVLSECESVFIGISGKQELFLCLTAQVSVLLGRGADLAAKVHFYLHCF